MRRWARGELRCHYGRWADVLSAAPRGVLPGPGPGGMEMGVVVGGTWWHPSHATPPHLPHLAPCPPHTTPTFHACLCPFACPTPSLPCLPACLPLPLLPTPLPCLLPLPLPLAFTTHTLPALLPPFLVLSLSLSDPKQGLGTCIGAWGWDGGRVSLTSLLSSLRIPVYPTSLCLTGLLSPFLLSLPFSDLSVELTCATPMPAAIDCVCLLTSSAPSSPSGRGTGTGKVHGSNRQAMATCCWQQHPSFHPSHPFKAKGRQAASHPIPPLYHHRAPFSPPATLPTPSASTSWRHLLTGMPCKQTNILQHNMCWHAM